MKTLKFFLVLILASTTFYCGNNEASIADMLRADATSDNQNMYVIEREVPGAGDLTAEELTAISQTSCSVLHEMGEAEIKWLHSYVTDNKIYCVYKATSEEKVREHAEQGGFPANSIAKVGTVIDPSTAEE